MPDKRKIRPEIPKEFPPQPETPVESPGKLPEVTPVPPEPQEPSPIEAPEPDIPDEQPEIPGENI